MARIGLKKVKQTIDGVDYEFRDAIGNNFTLEQFKESSFLCYMYRVHIRKRGSKEFLASNPRYGKKRPRL